MIVNVPAAVVHCFDSIVEENGNNRLYQSTGNNIIGKNSTEGFSLLLALRRYYHHEARNNCAQHSTNKLYASA